MTDPIQEQQRQQRQFYFEMFEEFRNEIRHQESQRSAVSAICVAFAGALIGASYQTQLLSAKPYLALLLINFSTIAILMLRKLYERFALGRERAKLYLKYVDDCNPANIGASFNHRLLTIWDEGALNNEKKYPFMSFIRLHHLWESLLIGAIFVGLAFVFVSGGKDPDFLQNLHLVGWPQVRGHNLRLLGLALAGPFLQSIVLRVYNWWQKTKALSDSERRPPVAPSKLFVNLRKCARVLWWCYAWDRPIKTVCGVEENIRAGSIQAASSLSADDPARNPE